MAAKDFEPIFGGSNFEIFSRAVQDASEKMGEIARAQQSTVRDHVALFENGIRSQLAAIERSKMARAIVVADESFTALEEILG